MNASQSVRNDRSRKRRMLPPRARAIAGETFGGVGPRLGTEAILQNRFSLSGATDQSREISPDPQDPTMCGILAYAGDVLRLPDFERDFDELRHRGPDDTEILLVADEQASLCFHRLAIMDPTQKGHQPFVDHDSGNVIICNGEIYNYESLKQDYESSYEFKSHSDCEVLIPMYRDLGIEEMCQHLDAEFALVIWDDKKKKLMAGRDPI